MIEFEWTPTNIKAFRESLFMSQEEFSNQLQAIPEKKPRPPLVGSSRSSVAMWEAGLSKPSYKMCKMMTMAAMRSGFKPKEK